MWVGVALRTNIIIMAKLMASAERHVFKRVWTPYPKYDNHSSLNEQHDWEDLSDQFNKHENRHFVSE